jgi:hypothetical protein
MGESIAHAARRRAARRDARSRAKLRRMSKTEGFTIDNGSPLSSGSLGA